MMKNINAHIADHELLQAIDGELLSHRVAEVHTHLESCWKCRARSGEIENTIARLMRMHDCEMAGMNADMPPIEQARARLKSQLEGARANVAGRSRARTWALGGAAAAVAVLCVIAANYVTLTAHAAPTPNSQLTPGATRSVSRNDICSAPEAGGLRTIPAPLANQVFQEYGIRNPKPRTWEVDFLITPALGGAADIRNLWPQPYASGEWNAHVKDALEDHLRNLVCEGKIDLSTAQHDIATDWISAYKKYFRTSEPLAVHAGFAEDPPWE